MLAHPQTSSGADGFSLVNEAVCVCVRCLVVIIADCTVHSAERPFNHILSLANTIPDGQHIDMDTTKIDQELLLQ